MALDPEFASEPDSHPDERWYKNFRLAWIAESLRVYGFINRKHIQRKFGISQAQCSVDLRDFQRLNPGVFRYDLPGKIYVSTKYPT